MKFFVILLALCLGQSLQVVGQTQERQYQINGKVQRNGTSFTNSGTVTNQHNGNVGTFNRQRTCTDRVCTGTNTYQTPQNQTYTGNFEATCQSGTCTKNSKILTPQGKGLSVDSSVTGEGQGAYSGQVKVTKP